MKITRSGSGILRWPALLAAIALMLLAACMQVNLKRQGEKVSRAVRDTLPYDRPWHRRRLDRLTRQIEQLAEKLPDMEATIEDYSPAQKDELVTFRRTYLSVVTYFFALSREHEISDAQAVFAALCLTVKCKEYFMSGDGRQQYPDDWSTFCGPFQNIEKAIRAEIVEEFSADDAREINNLVATLATHDPVALEEFSFGAHLYDFTLDPLGRLVRLVFSPFLMFYHASESLEKSALLMAKANEELSKALKNYSPDEIRANVGDILDDSLEKLNRSTKEIIAATNTVVVPAVERAVDRAFVGGETVAVNLAKNRDVADKIGTAMKRVEAITENLRVLGEQARAIVELQKDMQDSAAPADPAARPLDIEKTLDGAHEALTALNSVIEGLNRLVGQISAEKAGMAKFKDEVFSGFVFHVYAIIAILITAAAVFLLIVGRRRGRGASGASK